MNCPHCQHVLRNNAGFCDGCGLSLISFNTPTEVIDPATLADSLPDPNLISFIAFSPDGRTLFGGSYRALRLWDTGTWELKRENPMGEINPAYALSADGTQVATGGTNENDVKVWDAESGELKLTLNGHNKGVLSLAFSPAGRTLASGSYHEIKLWDVQTWTLKRTLAAEGMGITYRVAFSPDGKTLAGASDGTVKLWDVSGIKQGYVAQWSAGRAGGVLSQEILPAGAGALNVAAPAASAASVRPPRRLSAPPLTCSHAG